LIKLSPLGKVLGYRVLNYSSNEALNKEADMVKQRIINTIFPKNPKGDVSNIMIILRPEDKE